MRAPISHPESLGTGAGEPGVAPRTGSRAGGQVVVESMVEAEAGGLQKGSLRGSPPQHRHGSPSSENQQGRSAPEPRETGALVQGVHTGGEGGTPQQL